MPERRERRVVSVLFADLVGYTRTSERLDVEAVEGLLVPYHDALRRAVERLGGSVAKVMGDGAMAVFGAVRAHEDDPERAVRCAMTIPWSVADQQGSSGGLAIRVGVTTGEALVVVSDDGAVDAVGDVVNTAARLESAAPSNGVLVDERTYRATRRSIRYTQHASVRARGKSRPVEAWQAVAPLSPVPAQPTEDDLPLVGREEEHSRLVAALDRALGGPRAALVTVVGEPGIGKTRLLREFVGLVHRRPEGITVRHGRSLAYGEGIAFWALGEMVKQQAGIVGADDPSVAEEKLHAAVADVIPDGRDRDWIARHLRPLVGLDPDASATAGGRVEAFAAWRRFFESTAERRPLVLAFEDLHWADDALLDFVELLADRGGSVPLLIISTSRPDLLARRPAWETSDRVTIKLGRLTEQETRRFISGLLESSQIPEDVGESLTGASDGNPLFVREYVRMLQDQGTLQRGEGGWRLVAPLEGMPDSIQAVVAARIDTLAAPERAFVHDAAVVGRSAPLSAVCALSRTAPELAERMLTEIAARHLMRRGPREGATGDLEIAFTHALIQDVAYAQTRRVDRAEKHERTAEWMEQAGSGRDDTAELVAHHYRAALELRRGLGEDTSALAARTGTALVAAGRQAEAVNGHTAAARHYAAAEELLTEAATLTWAHARASFRADEPGAGELLARAYDALRSESQVQSAAEAAQLLGDWHRERSGDVDAAERWWGKAMRLSEASGNATLLVQIADGRAAVATEQHRFADAIAITREGRTQADKVGDTEGVARLQVRRGYAEVCIGDNVGIGRMQQAADTLADVGSRFTAAAYTDLSLAQMLTGDLRAASASCDRGASWAERFGEPRVLGDIESRQAFFAYQAGDWRTARQISTRHLNASNRWGAAFCIWTHALIAIAEGDDGAARDDNAALRRIHAPSAATCAVALAKARRAALTNRVRVPPWPQQHRYRNWDICAMAELIEIPPERQAIGAYAETLPDATMWKRALMAAAETDYAAAARIFDEIGSAPLAARAHALAAAHLAKRNEPDGAAGHLQHALTFFTAVGATRHAELAVKRVRE